MRFDDLYVRRCPLSVICVKGYDPNSVNEPALLLILHYTPSVRSIPPTTIPTLKCLCLGLISAWTQFGACTVSLVRLEFSCSFLFPVPRSNNEHSFCVNFV